MTPRHPDHVPIEQFGEVVTRVQQLEQENARLRADALTAEEARAYIALIDGPATYLAIHGWHYQHTDLTLSAAAKIRRTANPKQ